MRRRILWASLAVSSTLFSLAPGCGPSSSADDAGTADAADNDAVASFDGTTSDGETDAGGDGADATSIGAAFMYAAMGGSTNVVYGYAWDATSGHLTPIDMDSATAGIQGAPTGAYPIAVVAHPSGKWVYAVTQGSPVVISAYAVNLTTGVLTEINADTRMDAGVNRLSLSLAYMAGLAAVDPAGRCLYVADQNGSLIALTIDTTGALTVARVVSGGPATWIAVDPASRFLVTSNNGEVAIHKLDAVTGLPIGPDGGAGPGTVYTTPGGSSVALDPSGTHAYTPFYYTSKVHSFLIDAAAPSLTPMPETTVSNEPVASLVDPSGSYLYTNGTNGTGFGVLAIGDGGALTELPSDAGVYSILGAPLAFGPTGKQLYTSFYPYENIVFANVGANGSLTAGGAADEGGTPYNPARTYAWVVRP